MVRQRKSPTMAESRKRLLDSFNQDNDSPKTESRGLWLILCGGLYMMFLVKLAFYWHDGSLLLWWSGGNNSVSQGSSSQVKSKASIRTRVKSHEKNIYKLDLISLQHDDDQTKQNHSVDYRYSSTSLSSSSSSDGEQKVEKITTKKHETEKRKKHRSKNEGKKTEIGEEGGGDLPPEWVDATFHNIRDILDCKPLYKTARPAPKPEQWEKLKAVYIREHFDEKDDTSKLPGAPTIPLPLVYPDRGMQVPYEVRVAGKKGRGIFATEPIPKGTLVFAAHPGGGHVHFTTGEDFRRYIWAVGDRELSCEILQCAAVEYHGTPEEPKTHARVTVDLDDGCLVNSCDDCRIPGEDYDVRDDSSSSEDEGSLNTGCLHTGAPDEDCVNRDYALRDISAGEEILMHYGDYVVTKGWKWFGLRR